MTGFAEAVARRLEAIEREQARLRRGLIRHGTVKTVDADAGTVVLTWPGGEVDSAPMPWFQHSMQHHAPQVGDHAIALDPSLVGRGAVALVGWPSAAKPPAESGGADRIALYTHDEGSDTYDAGSRTISGSGDFSVVAGGQALIESQDVRLGDSPTDFAALASLVDTLFTTIDTVFRTAWAPVAMDGGAALKAAWVAALATPPQSVAASEVRVK